MSFVVGNVCAAIEKAPSLDVIEIKKINSPFVWDGNVNDPEWMNATFLDFNFTFANGKSYRANVYLGHNGTHFFVGAILFNVGPNPTTVPDYVTRPDGFYIYFDVNNDGKLTPPEDAKGLLNFIGVYHGQTFWSSSISKDGFWDSEKDPLAVQFWHERRPEVEGEILWAPDENAWPPEKVHYSSTHGSGGYYDGDQHFEFYFSLNSDDMLSDGLHLTGGAKTVGFALEFYRQGYDLENGTRIPDLYDFWPGEGFTPNVFVNPSEYAKMFINLKTQTNNPLDNLRILFITLTAGTILILIIFGTISRKIKTKSCHRKFFK
ncbi:MAG: hypothetical protein QHH12_06790 [Candidatus Bathyarchaeota archaeon]|nr:hypothetical protein [Candidatus Bathyarchaeota archaeon]